MASKSIKSILIYIAERQDGHNIHEAPRLMGGTIGSRGGFSVRSLAKMQANFLYLQHALSAELAEVAFCLSLGRWSTTIRAGMKTPRLLG